jgi:hypothetical protein
MGTASLERAALVGLQDSMPRAALLSIHARVVGAQPSTWEDPALVQVWGPRFSAFVVPARDHALFTVARYPDDARGRGVAEDMAARLRAFLDGRRMRYDDVGEALGVHPNRLRYATTTGTVLIRWEGARRPVIWTVPRPKIDPFEARLELARRYLNGFGPTSFGSFASWAGIGEAQGRAAFDALSNELIPVGTPIGELRILTADEASFRKAPSPAAPARLLPSGDPYFLLWGSDRELLVPDAARRSSLWTSRVWPGAVLVGGEVVGTWRRAEAVVDVATWRRVSPSEREAVEAEATSMPLAGLGEQIVVRWGA